VENHVGLSLHDQQLIPGVVNMHLLALFLRLSDEELAVR